MDHLPVRLDGFSSVEASTRFKFSREKYDLMS